MCVHPCVYVCVCMCVCVCVCVCMHVYMLIHTYSMLVCCSCIDRSTLECPAGLVPSQEEQGKSHLDMVGVCSDLVGTEVAMVIPPFSSDCITGERTGGTQKNQTFRQRHRWTHCCELCVDALL